MPPCPSLRTTRYGPKDAPSLTSEAYQRWSSSPQISPPRVVDHGLHITRKLTFPRPSCYGDGVLIAVQHLLIKVRQPRSRADELIAVRRRLRHELAQQPRDEERALARDVLARKLDVAAELHSISSCHTCATGEPW